MHTHVSTVAIGTAFVGVVLMGTLWRLLAAHMVTSGNPTVSNFGKAMAFQY